jgi:hypothetical protein
MHETDECRKNVISRLQQKCTCYVINVNGDLSELM